MTIVLLLRLRLLVILLLLLFLHFSPLTTSCGRRQTHRRWLVLSPTLSSGQPFLRGPATASSTLPLPLGTRGQQRHVVVVVVVVDFGCAGLLSVPVSESLSLSVCLSLPLSLFSVAPALFALPLFALLPCPRKLLGTRPPLVGRRGAAPAKRRSAKEGKSGTQPIQLRPGMAPRRPLIGPLAAPRPSLVSLLCKVVQLQPTRATTKHPRPFFALILVLVLVFVLVLVLVLSPSRSVRYPDLPVHLPSLAN